MEATQVEQQPVPSVSAPVVDPIAEFKPNTPATAPHAVAAPISLPVPAAPITTTPAYDASASFSLPKTSALATMQPMHAPQSIDGSAGTPQAPSQQSTDGIKRDTVNVLYSQMAAATYALSANDSLAANNPAKAKEYVSLIHECAASIGLLEIGRR